MDCERGDYLTSKRSCFRRPCGNQPVNGFQTLLKLARHHYYPIFPCIWDILSWKKSALVWSEILRLFVNTLTADNKYSRCNVHNFAQQVQTPLSEKLKTFWGFFIAFLKCAWNLEHFEKKDEYPSLIISEIMDCERGDYLTSKRSCFTRPCGNQTVNGFQTLLKSARQNYDSIFPCIWDILSWQKSALVWSEILRLFVNTLTVDNKYSLCNVHNFDYLTSKRSCFTRPCGNQTVNGFQTLLKSARQNYDSIFPCIWDILSWQKSALVWSEILRLFVNTLTVDNKYSLCNVHNFAQQVQTPLSQKEKTFCGFFIPFLKCALNLEHFEKKYEYPSLIISEIMDCERGDYLTSKRSCFRRPYGNQPVNGFQTLLNSARHHYYPIFPCIWDILSWKKSALVWSEILRLFVNTLTADNKYSRCNVHNFAQQVQTRLSQKQKTFYGFFTALLKSAWNLEHFKKKDEYPSLII